MIFDGQRSAWRQGIGGIEHEEDSVRMSHHLGEDSQVINVIDATVVRAIACIGVKCNRV
jgi:hypothetical protein